MAQAGGIAGRTAELCRPIVEKLGLELLEVKYQKEGSRYFLRIIIDKRGGVGIDDCEAVSRAADPLIEENINIKQSYYLEVQSPGLDRPLKTLADFHRYEGEEVELKFYRAHDGVKKLAGVIEDADEDNLYLDVDNERRAFPLEEIALVKRVIKF